MDTSRKRILVVEDESFLQTLLVATFEDAGHSVVAAGSLREARTLLEQRTIRMVLLDLGLPDGDGLDLLREIRETHSDTQLPVFILSARQDDLTLDEALQFGANDVMSKPLRPELLLRRIEAALRSLQTDQHPALDILDMSISELPEYELYCPNCDTVAQAHHDKCERCGIAQPPTGWEPIPYDRYPQLGAVLNRRYLLEQLVGEGMSGTVYRALDTQLGRHVAAKVVSVAGHRSPERRSEMLLQLKNEVQAVARLRSPHIVQIIDIVGVDDSTVAILMEFLDGMDLQAMVKRFGRLNVSDATAIVRQVALALLHAHREKLIHCDVKPHNISLESLPKGGKHARVLDFGVVRALDANDTTDEPFFGTPAYAAPEMIREGNHAIDHRVDIYALGCVLYFALVGSPPFKGGISDVCKAHLNDSIPSLPESVSRRDKVRDYLDEVIAKATQKDARRRHSSMAVFIEHLDGLEKVVRESTPTTPS